MKRRIVVCDSNTSILKAFAMLLEDMDTKVVSLMNTLQLIEVLEEFDPDILFIDIPMPQQNCDSMLQKIKASGKLQNLPIIVLCRNVMDRASVKAAGAEGCLVKPFGFLEVESYIRRFVYKR